LHFLKKRVGMLTAEWKAQSVAENEEMLNE
jgi:hypothetical protein